MLKNRAATFEEYPGTPGVTLDDVAHLLIPGRHRSPDGMDISDIAKQRADTAADFYVKHLLGTNGVIVCSGYKSPVDRAGRGWYEGAKRRQGIPEAYSLQSRVLMRPEIPEHFVLTEPDSIDTASNFTRSQVLFPDEEPVGIVAQRRHLVRIMKVIAPRTMRRPYVGIVAPEVPGHVDRYAPGITLASRIITRGITPDTPNATETIEERVERIYGLGLVKMLTNRHLPKAFEPGYELASESAKI